ncbi:MAG TPA: outer membrane protein assembly factor BamD [Candidatus Acidoferrales bacterium]|nr:outer membrane protein assembly factor BamD [Candidatus Acidoferrales bacterium]
MASTVRVAALAAACTIVLAGCGASIAPQIHNDADRVPAARQLYDQHDYSLAIDLLSNYATTGTGNADIDQAVYLLGLAYLGQKEYANAETQFERIAHDYPESDSATAAAFRLGQALYGQSRDYDFDQEFTLRALKQWESFVRDSPDDPWAPEAKQGIANCRERLAAKLWRNGDVYVKLKLYEPARFYFRNVIESYADTPSYGDAVIGLAVADARLGKRDSALTLLGDLENDHKGEPLALRAAAMRAKVEKWPPEGDVKARRHRTVEPGAPPPQSPTPTTTTPFQP